MDSIEKFSQKSDIGTLTDAAASVESLIFERKKPELRKVLRKKLIIAKQEKQTLEDVIANKNNEIIELKKSIDALNEIINSVSIEDLKKKSQLGSLKIDELNKKNRQLQSELDSVRIKSMRLDAKVAKLETDLKIANEKKKEKEILNHKAAEASGDGIQLQLTQTKQKLFETLNQNVALKTQLKLAQKCIQQEIGENVNLNILSTSGSSWRGRAQKIMTLQLKLNELKDQLETSRSEPGCADENSNDQPVRREQIYHRAEVDILHKDISTLTAHIEEQNQKFAALKARNKNLTADTAKMRENIALLENLIANNDATTTDLEKKITMQKVHYENKIRDVQKQADEKRKGQVDFEFHMEEMNIKLGNIQAELENRDENIKELNSTIGKLERDLKSVCGDYLFECRNFRKEEFEALLNSLESEKTNLLALNKILNGRLEDERSRVLSLTEQISKQKVKICRLEGKIRDIEKDQDTQMEKKKRSHRISEYTNSIINSSSVSSFVFENSSMSDLPPKTDDKENKESEVIELKYKLEIANEKISILEDKLNYLNEEKQSDARSFENIIKMSKSILLETIHQVKADDGTVKNK